MKPPENPFPALAVLALCIIALAIIFGHTAALGAAAAGAISFPLHGIAILAALVALGFIRQ